ncbi:MFS transporter [Amycolatopsis deserti]|uniref:MFS transporter n=1 Tax=Amycolatopsis deserti TaxID=185696 RepID=A0ABQ3II56_9PSEU|nr:MFS transporter [Amycolatopsis deserti]GHE79927.1 MFS transporter [Amycolatopsis deserti]
MTEIGSAPDRTKLWRKVALRTFPLLGAAYVLGYIDRVNIGFVAAPMSRDLGLTNVQIGLTSTLFFIGYIIATVPSNLALRRFGAPTWIGCTLLAWGTVTAVMAAVDSAGALYVLRVLLGLAEAGLAPGVLLYITYWFPAKQRAWAYPVFVSVIAVSGIVGAPLSAGLLEWGQHLTGMAGWRSVFLVEGVITVVVGILLMARLAKSPATAKWLSTSERQYIQDQLDAEAALKRNSAVPARITDALKSGRVWALAFAFFALTFGIYAFSYFLPQMLQLLTNKRGASPTDVTSVLLSAIPSAFALLVMLVWPKVFARRSAVFSTVLPLSVGTAGVVLAALTSNPVAFLVGTCLSFAGIYTSLSQFWRIPVLGLTGAAAAAGIAVINSSGNLTGIVSPLLTGSIQQATGSFRYALLLIAFVMVLGVVTVLVVGPRIERMDTGSPAQSQERKETV